MAKKLTTCMNAGHPRKSHEWHGTMVSPTIQRETSRPSIAVQCDELPIAAQRDADSAANVVIAVIEAADVAVASGFSNLASLIDVSALAGATSFHAKNFG